MTRPFLIRPTYMTLGHQPNSDSERMRKVDRMAFEAMMIAGHGEE